MFVKCLIMFLAYNQLVKRLPRVFICCNLHFFFYTLYPVMSTTRLFQENDNSFPI